MTLIKRKRVLAAKAETTSGTAESLTTAEASFNAYDIVIQNEIEIEEREGQGAFGYLAGVTGGYKGRITFKIDSGWDGTATEPSWADTFLPACGWVKSGQVFTPRTEAPGANVTTLTMGVYVDGVLKIMRGCAGTFKWVCPTGRPAYLEFDYMGVWIAPTDVAVLAPTYPTALPLRYATSTTTFAGTALCLENITLDAGNTVIMRECAATVAGYEAALIVNRNPKVTGNPEAKLVATRNAYGQFLASTEGILTWNLDGPTNSALTIAAPKAQIIKITEGDRNGLVTDEIEWQCNKNGSTADQEVSITFTAAT
jgi:hypothetical protein